MPTVLELLKNVDAIKRKKFDAIDEKLKGLLERQKNSILLDVAKKRGKEIFYYEKRVSTDVIRRRKR